MALALETKSLVKRFGALAVANDIDFTLERGARHALIGPNGAGKTSFVNLVTGVLTPRKGGGLVQSSIERLMRSKVYFGRPLASFVDRSSPMEGQLSKIVVS